MSGKKIAVVGDIHANLDALGAVIDDARAQGVTEWLCVGDVVGYNACPNECVEAVRALGCPVVCGNHDHYCGFDESLEDFHPIAAAVVEWTRRELKPENAAWLRTLPYSLVHGGVTLVHATLDEPERWGYVFEAVDADPSFFYQATQVCFHGHTHVPAVFEKRGGVVARFPPENVTLSFGCKYFVNVGSVGQPRDSDRRASYCIFDPALRSIEFRRLQYDIAAAQERIRKAGLPERLAKRLELGR